MITRLPSGNRRDESSASNAVRADRHKTALPPKRFSQARAETKWRLPEWHRS
jgi:hypothetical protein